VTLTLGCDRAGTQIDRMMDSPGIVTGAPPRLSEEVDTALSGWALERGAHRCAADHRGPRVAPQTIPSSQRASSVIRSGVHGGS
jgi:hypothetical protein